MPLVATDPVPDDVGHTLMTLGSVVGAVILGCLAASIITFVMRRAGRRSSLVRDIAERERKPDGAILVVVAVWIAIAFSTKADDTWRIPVEHLLLIALIAAVAWWTGAFAFVFEDRILLRYSTAAKDSQHARRIRTQVTILRRLTVVALVLCAVSGILLTFAQARAAGASLLASAGLISIIAGLAAQTSLSNVFAGVQLVFSDAIRVGDVVVVGGEYGTIEEITLTYVVLHIWDDRRLIMPSTYFTTTPYANWTRHAPDLLGTVELDLDFRVPLDAMRDELTRILEGSDLWDRRAGSLSVTDAVGGYAHVRALVSGRNASDVWDLRCLVRERLIGWVQAEVPDALPRTRVVGLGGGDGAGSVSAGRQAQDSARQVSARN